MREQEFSSDGQLHDVDRPVIDPVAAKPPTEPADIFAASEPASAAQRLRAFEDEHLGPDAVRINGEVEKGHGSLFKTLSPAHHRYYNSLGRLVEAEAAKNEAAATAARADADHAAALQEVEDATIERSESEKGSG